MRVVVLKRPRIASSSSGTQNVAVRGTSGETTAREGLRVEVLEGASRKDTADLRRDPEVEAVAPSMPIQLIRPAARAAVSVASKGGASWGIEAVGARKCATTHEAFSGLKFTDCNVRNFTTGDKHDVHDDDGHGTHCAGTILGRDVNGTRIGVAPGVTDVLIAKIIGKNGGTFEAIADAVEWAHVHGAHILSMSLGMDFVAHLAALEAEGDMPPEQARSQALVDYGACIRLFDRLCEFVADRYNTHRGMLVVAAAGNESERPRFRVTVQPPADAFGIVSVAALGRPSSGKKLAVAPFSNRGAHFGAPGVGIVSAGLAGGLASMDRTSMAAPHVAGVAALWAEPLVATSRAGKIRRDVLLEDIRKGVRALRHLDSEDIGAGLVMAPL
jgi:subtilisin family serine protease